LAQLSLLNRRSLGFVGVYFFLQFEHILVKIGTKANLQNPAIDVMCLQFWLIRQFRLLEILDSGGVQKVVVCVLLLGPVV
jgi:hypothetical protein